MSANHTEVINFKLPLPLDMVSTLLKLIGGAYPSAMMSTEMGSHMSVTVDLADRVPDGDIDKFLAGFQPDLAEPEIGSAQLLPGGGISAPEWILQALKPFVEEVLGDAPNYTETKFSWRGADGVLIVARSEGQTPDELRKKAERRLAQAEEHIALLEARLEELGYTE